MFSRNRTWPQVSYWFNGHEYRSTGWFGCQLESWEWTPTTSLLGFTTNIHVVTTHRQGLKVRTTWSINQQGTHEEYHQRIIELKENLRSI